MDMELFILVSTAKDFSVAAPGKSGLFNVMRIVAIVIIAFCALGHFVEFESTPTMVQV